MSVLFRLIALAAAASTVLVSPAVAAEPTWHVAPIPETTATSNLWDVAATGAGHAWAVGAEGFDPEQPDTTGDPLILRRTRTGWSRAPLPTVSKTVSFRRVAASSPTDVWVVGGPRSQGTDDVITLVWRFNGTTWTEVPYPAGATPSGLTIRDLSVVDGRAWLVGYRGSATVLHEWTGQAWVEHAPPAECTMGGFPNFCNFTAVKAFAPDDVWAAGNGWWPGFTGPALFHWNGTAWRAVQVGVNQQPFSFRALDGRSSTEIWAVGDDGSSRNLVVRGDGTTWEQISGLVGPFATGVAVGANGAPWALSSHPLPTFNTYVSGAWAMTMAPRAAYHAITAVPGTNRMITVGSVDVPGTSPLRVRATIVEYGPTC